MSLNGKQERFCEEYLIDLNATKAAIRAGYSAKTAQEQSSRLLSNVIIASRIRELKEKRSERTDITADFVLNGLKEVAQRCLQHKPVMRWDYEDKMMVQETGIDEKGNTVGIFEFDSNGANRSFELLGKHLGIFEKDNKQKTPAVSAEELNKLSPQELKTLLALKQKMSE